MKLSERAMLSALHVGMWGASATDREVGEEVIENHRAEQGAGHYSKKLVAGKFLSPVTSKISKAKATHKLLTLPWDDDGTRILSSMAFTEYTSQMRLRRLEVEAAAKDFVANHLPEAIKEASKRLGTMFDPNDYPSAEEISKKFRVDVEIKPVPEAGDFRAKLSEASVKAIVKDIERRSDQRIEQAMNDVFLRVQDVTGKMVERLRSFEPPTGEEKAKNTFKDSLVYNINELADLLDVLNITGDPRVEKLKKQLKDDLVEHSPEVLRADEKARKKTADKAEQIYKKVSTYLA